LSVFFEANLHPAAQIDLKSTVSVNFQRDDMKVVDADFSRKGI
jgi:hypothetical protein